jgi:glutamyl-tRNA synthetase
VGPVLGKLLAERPDLRPSVKEITPVIAGLLKEVNEIPLAEQKRIVETNWPELLVEEARIEAKGLPPLPNASRYEVIHTRFCPNPDGALHLGGARAAILCDEYATMYKGRMTLRFDDTDPRTKSPIPEAYDWIREDLRWLGVRWHNEFYQSDRLEAYYAYARKLIEMGDAYVCVCEPEVFRKLVLQGRSCSCRGLPQSTQLSRWEMMLNGAYGEGEAVVRVKTDLTHPNPAVREWPALRIVDTERYPHPRNGSRHRVWPLFAFCCAIDDHEAGISHVLRGKEHLTNSVRQSYLYSYLGWQLPEALHYGRLKLYGTVLSKSKIRDGIRDGLYSGWDDPRLGTLMALRRRGISPQAIRRMMVEFGPKPVDATLNWENLYSTNRKILDPAANRYFFVEQPLELTVRGIPKPYVSEQPLHPSDPSRGSRVCKVTPTDGSFKFLVAEGDRLTLESGRLVRLMGLFNIKVEKSVEDGAIFRSESYAEAREASAPLIHWIPAGTGVRVRVIMPDSSEAVGVGEDSCLDLRSGSVVQFERFGFVRVGLIDGGIVAYYAHK